MPRISELPTASSADNADELPANQSGVTRKVTVAQVRAGLASAAHTHAASDITSGTLPVARGGTGSGDAATARANLGAAASGLVTSSGLAMAASRLLGRTTSGTGAVEEISVGSGLVLSSGVLSATGGGGGGDPFDVVSATAGATYAGTGFVGNTVVALTMTGNTVVSPPSGTFPSGQRITVVYELTASGGTRAPSFPAFTVAGGITPVRPVAAGDTLTVVTYTDNGGTTWYLAGVESFTSLPVKATPSPTDVVVIADTADGGRQKSATLSAVVSGGGAAAAGVVTSSGLTMGSSRLLGRTSSGAGAVEEIEIGSGLALSSGVLSATGGGGGGDPFDVVTGSAGATYQGTGFTGNTIVKLTMTGNTAVSPPTGSFQAGQRVTVVYELLASGESRTPSFPTFVLTGGVTPLQPVLDGNVLTVVTYTDDGGATWNIAGVENFAAVPEKAAPSATDRVVISDSADGDKQKSATLAAVVSGGGGAVAGAVGSSGLTMSSARLLGRSTAGTGAVEEITLGGGLTLSEGVLSASGGGGGGGAGDLGLDPPRWFLAQALVGSGFTLADILSGRRVEHSYRHWATWIGSSGGVVGWQSAGAGGSGGPIIATDPFSWAINNTGLPHRMAFRLNSGAAANNYGQVYQFGYYSGVSMRAQPSQGVLPFAWGEVGLDVLSDATDTYRLRVGLTYETLNAAASDNVGPTVALFYTHGTNGGRWCFLTRGATAAGAQTLTDTGIEAVAQVWYRWAVVALNDTTLRVWISDGTNTFRTNVAMPTGSVYDLVYAARITKTAGSTAQNALLRECGVGIVFV